MLTKKLHGFLTNTQNRVSQLFPAPQSSSRAPAHKKVKKDSIHVNASTESISASSKVIKSANITCIFFAIKKYLDDLQQGNRLLEQREKEKKRNFLPPPKERSSVGVPRSVKKMLNAERRCSKLQKKRSPEKRVVSLRV